MRVLVLGAGEVGFHLAERLSQENQDVVIIESDPERADFASQQLDVLTVVGNGASLSVLEKAGVRDARMLLAVSSRDEVNLIACLAAKRLGVQYAVARISNPDYYDRGSVLSREQMGIDLMRCFYSSTRRPGRHASRTTEGDTTPAHRVPKRRSPASPRPGRMYPTSFSSRSSAAA